MGTIASNHFNSLAKKLGSMKHLEKLTLNIDSLDSPSRINNEFCSNLAESLTEMKRLQSLDWSLEGSIIDSYGYEAFGHALAQVPSLKAINLYIPTQEIVQAQVDELPIQQVNNNQQDFRSLFTALSCLPNISRVNVGPITGPCFQGKNVVLFEILSQLTQVQDLELCLFGQTIPFYNLNPLRDCLLALKNLKKLKLTFELVQIVPGGEFDLYEISEALDCFHNLESLKFAFKYIQKRMNLPYTSNPSPLPIARFEVPCN